MKFTAHLLSQAGIWLFAVLTILANAPDAPWFHFLQTILPTKYQGVALALCGLASATLGLLHQFVNPDGTKALTAWSGKIAVLLLSLFLAGAVYAQAPTPTPVSSTYNFSIGAGAFGLGGTSQATPATDVVLTLNPGFSNKYLNGLELRDDNLLAPGALNYFGAGSNWEPPISFPATSAFAPLSFYVDGTVGVALVTPTGGPSQSHIGFTAGGGLRWLMSSGVRLTLFEMDLLHAPGAPWGTNSPAYTGSISYLWGNPSQAAQTRRALAKRRKAEKEMAKREAQAHGN